VEVDEKVENTEEKVEATQAKEVNPAFVLLICL